MAAFQVGGLSETIIVGVLLPLGTWVVTAIVAIPVIKYILADLIRRVDAVEKKHDALIEKMSTNQIDIIRAISEARNKERFAR